MSSFKSSENIQKKEGWPDKSVSDNQSSSVTLDELLMKAKVIAFIINFGDKKTLEIERCNSKKGASVSEVLA